MMGVDLALDSALALLENLPSMVVVTDCNKRVIYVNPTFESVTGTRFESIKGLQIDRQIDSTEILHYSKEFILEALEKTVPWQGEYSGKSVKGNEFWVRVNSFGILHDGVSFSHNVYIIDDITASRSYQIELSAEKSRLEAIFKNAPVGMIFVNRGNRIVDINDFGAEMLNGNSQSVIGKLLCDVLYCHQKELNLRNCCFQCDLGSNIQGAFKSKEMPKDIEYKQLIKGRQGILEKWFKARISTMEVKGQSFALVILEDITVRKQIANELIDNEKRLRLITDNMLDLITQVDSNGVIIYATPSHFSILGYHPEDVIGKALMDFVFYEDRPMAQEHFKRRLLTCENFTSEMRIVKYDGSYLWLESTGNAIADEVYGTSILYVSRDTTIRKQAEYESLKAKEQAIEANRSKSQFLANMSHEIRTPLNGIIGMTNLTIMTDINAEQKENLVMVKNSAITLLNIINDILDFSKLEAGKVVIEKIRFNLGDIIQRGIKPLKVQALEKGIDLDVKIYENVPEYVHGDPVRINQVLVNLITNALKFTSKGGVLVEVKAQSIKNEKAEIMFSVQDTGIGISEDDLERIFMSFSQADGSITRKYGGTGLGLSISKMLVGLMGGQLAVNSQLNYGSNFHFTIPLKIAQNVVLGVGMEEDLEYVPEVEFKLDILVCEDEKINQKLFKRLLVKQGHNVSLAENGIQAIDILKKQTFDLILMDIQMPIMDGLSALSIIRNELKLAVPVIAVTAYALKGDRERFLAAGMNEYISKPINIREFYEKIERLGTKEGNHKRDELLEKVLHLEEEGIVVKKENYVMPLYDIKLFIDQNDAEMLEKTSHRIKELFEADGAVRLKRLAMKMELAARRQNLKEATQYYTEILKLMNI